jgi:crotonobetainyl-CoA:carnitine CoA-transferase CaiB-like acyl-CoA transferase
VATAAGADTNQILEGIGVSQEEIEGLRASGAIA